MTTRLAGGRVYDPLNGIDGKVMDLWVRDGRIVAPPADGRADEVIDLAGKVVLPGRHRPAQPHRRRQGQHRPHDAARGAPRARPAAPRALPQRQRPLQPVDLHHRLRLCPHGLHHGVRAGDAAGQCPPGPPGDGRRAAPGQRCLRPARQRRPVPARWSGTAPAPTRSATMSPGRSTPPRRWRSRSSTPAGSAPSSSTAASSTSTRQAPSTGSPRAPSSPPWPTR